MQNESLHPLLVECFLGFVVNNDSVEVERDAQFVVCFLAFVESC